MDFQDILMSLSDYSVNCKIMDGWLVIGVTFNRDWQILRPSNPSIELVENSTGSCYYGAPLKDVTVDEVFNSIMETIEYNKDIEKKVLLFRDKVAELKALFSQEDYDTLKQLEFKFKKRKGKKVEKQKDSEDKENISDEQEHVSEETQPCEDTDVETADNTEDTDNPFEDAGSYSDEEQEKIQKSIDNNLSPFEEL